MCACVCVCACVRACVRVCVVEGVTNERRLYFKSISPHAQLTLKGINPMHERFIPDPDATKPDTWHDSKWIVVPNYILGEVSLFAKHMCTSGRQLPRLLRRHPCAAKMCK